MTNQYVAQPSCATAPFPEGGSVGRGQLPALKVTGSNSEGKCAFAAGGDGGGQHQSHFIQCHHFPSLTPRPRVPVAASRYCLTTHLCDERQTRTRTHDSEGRASELSVVLPIRYVPLGGRLADSRGGQARVANREHIPRSSRKIAFCYPILGCVACCASYISPTVLHVCV